MHRAVRILIIIVVGLLVYQRSKFLNKQTVHHPPAHILQEYPGSNGNFYRGGGFEYSPNLSFIEKYSRKKINNFLFIIDNTHKLQVALIDLGYIKILNTNYFGKDETYSFEEQVSFELPEDFNELSNKINKNQEKFRLVYDQVYEGDVLKTSFDILITRSDGEISLKAHHFQPKNSCVTYVREGVISYKCYGGYAVGEAKVEIRKGGEQIVKHLSLSQENTVADFDGFRASGWQWTWIWGMGTGFTQTGYPFSINFGKIRDIGQDFLYVKDEKIRLTNFQYVINETSSVGDSITFKNEDPDVDLQFKITAKQRKYQDMVVLKSDMMKWQGYWSGYYTNNRGVRQTIKDATGLVETADSIF